MFHRKTVFVIGAGASKEVGLPLGDDLRDEARDSLNIAFDLGGTTQKTGDSEIADALRTYARQKSPKTMHVYLQAARQLRDALPQAESIDNLLDAHQGNEALELCGKLAIVRCISQGEQKSSLFIGESGNVAQAMRNLKGAWFTPFWRLLVQQKNLKDVESLFDNVSFIVFNYDRCIEHFLLLSLMNYYGLDERRAGAIVAKVRIIHPYGSLGPLPWQVPNDPGVGFGTHRADWLELAQRIRTFTERMSDEDVMTRIRQTMADAHVTVFLGFAYHTLNMELLRPSAGGGTRIYGTALGISGHDQQSVERSLRNVLQCGTEDAVSLLPTTCEGLFSSFRMSMPLGH